MEKLSTKQLLEAYNNAIKLNLNKEFIDLLSNELNKRKAFQSFFDKQRCS